MIIMVVCCAISFISACITYFSINKISSDIYIKTVQVHEGLEPVLPDSPYSVKRALDSNKNLGFAIMKNDKHIHIAGGNGSLYEIFHDVSSAQKAINFYEKLDGVKLTKLSSMG